MMPAQALCPQPGEKVLDLSTEERLLPWEAECK